MSTLELKYNKHVDLARRDWSVSKLGTLVILLSGLSCSMVALAALRLHGSPGGEKC